MPTIVDLPEVVADLPVANRARFERIFRVDRVEGECRVPAAMRTWVERHFGSVAVVERQRVVRVTNLVTFDGALFNPLRSRRPVAMSGDGSKTTDNARGNAREDAREDPRGDAHASAIDDVFADPLRTTTEDVFGRVRGRYCITASNVARWEGQGAVLIFDEPDPLAFTRDHLRDYFQASLEWARRAHRCDPQARYFLWMWNGGLKGGASVAHAHAQIGLGRGMHYAQVERLRRAALAYRERHGANYFDDLLAAHEDVGLDIRAGCLRGFVYLAANRPKDIWILGRAFADDLADALHDVLRGLIERTGTRAFDVAVLMPPLYAPPFEERSEDWSGFPVIARLGDRGSPDMISSDIGAIDLYAHNTIAADPFEVRRAWEGERLSA